MGFVAAAQLDQLAEATPTRVEVDGVPVCLVRSGERVRAIHDVCSHQRWSLSEGLVFGDGVECSLHGSTFDLDTGQPSTLPATTAVPTFAVRLTGSAVEIDVSSAANGAAFPRH